MINTNKTQSLLMQSFGLLTGDVLLKIFIFPQDEQILFICCQWRCSDLKSPFVTKHQIHARCRCSFIHIQLFPSFIKEQTFVWQCSIYSKWPFSCQVQRSIPRHRLVSVNIVCSFLTVLKPLMVSTNSSSSINYKREKKQVGNIWTKGQNCISLYAYI